MLTRALTRTHTSLSYASKQSFGEQALTATGFLAFHLLHNNLRFFLCSSYKPYSGRYKTYNHFRKTKPGGEAMHHVKVNGTELAYNEEGSGESVIFVHGVFNDLRSWKHQMDAFGSEFRAVAVSCRYHYPNEPIPVDAEYRLEALADDLGAFLRALDLAPAHLIGNSSGAFVCLLLAHKRPELVRSLTLAEPPVLSVLGVSIPPKPIELLKLFVQSPTTTFDVVKFGAKGIGPAQKAFERGNDKKGVQAFTQTVLGQKAAANMTEFMHQQIQDNMGPFRAVIRTGLPHFSATDARHVDVPTLLVAGEHSAPAQQRVMDKLERVIPGTERLDIRDASHLMYEDQPEVFNREVLSFLKNHR